MNTRAHVREEAFAVDPATLFALLHTPSAIRDWWGAARAVVIGEPGGAWAAAWGESEDQPDYVTVATIAEFDPPRRLVLTDYRYHNAAGALPFEADLVTTFEVAPTESGATLRVTQSGFPAGPEADDFYQGCDAGWRATFEGIRRVVERESSGSG